MNEAYRGGPRQGRSVKADGFVGTSGSSMLCMIIDQTAPVPYDGCDAETSYVLTYLARKIHPDHFWYGG